MHCTALWNFTQYLFLNGKAVKPLFIVSEGTAKVNDEWGKTIVAAKLFIWAMYRDQRN
jgi:hypothetical protein